MDLPLFIAPYLKNNCATSIYPFTVQLICYTTKKSTLLEYHTRGRSSQCKHCFRPGCAIMNAIVSSAGEYSEQKGS